LNVITLDFETYYDPVYSLSKMTTQEYILDPRFQTIGVAIAVNDQEPVWYTHDAVKPALEAIDWANSIVVCHNTQFDGAILAWRYQAYPALLVCTMSVAAAVGLRTQVGGSLGKLADFFRGIGANIPAKGSEVVNALGKRIEAFSPAELAAYGDYCKDDVRITRGIFNIMKAKIPRLELMYQDMILRAYTEPQFRLDANVLSLDLVRVRDRKKELMRKLCVLHQAEDEASLKSELMSNQKFAGILESLGVDIPMKISKTTNKETYAFAKTDVGMQELLEHEDEHIRALAETRLGVKSTIEESRLEKLLQLSRLPFLAVPYKISGAHTHRLSGADGINLQNLPSGRLPGQSKAMRQSLVPLGDGRLVVAVDSAQIEARTLAWLAQETWLLEAFAQGRDPYSVMASFIYAQHTADEILQGHKAGDEEFKKMRQIGKSAALGAGFGIGAANFRRYCRTVAGVDIDEAQAKAVIDIYRAESRKIVDLWSTCGNVLLAMTEGSSGHFAGPQGKTLHYDGKAELFGMRVPGIQLPDGLWIYYPQLKAARTKRGFDFTFERPYGKATVTTKTYGAKIVENVTQAVAFAAMKFQMLNINTTSPLAMNVHDEAVMTADQADGATVVQNATGLLSLVPEWMAGCPLKGEGGMAMNYGDC
jgi:DNA polymerase I-like protein with 3'-5' exonuclease and polymerase domains